MDAVSDGVPIRFADAEALLDQGDLDGALRAYEALVESFPRDHEAWHKLGRCFQKRKQPDDAERCYREAISLWSDYPQPNNNLGLILFDRGHHAEAERHYRIALAERPDYLEAHLNLGNLLIENFRYLEAQYFASRAAVIDPLSPAAHLLLGQALSRNGRQKDGMAAFERAVDLDAKFVPGWVNLGSAYRLMCRFSDAERAYSTAAAADQTLFAAWHNQLMLSNYRPGEREDVFLKHKAFGAQLRRQCGSKPAIERLARPDPDRRLRVGFLSADFRRHSVAYFIKGALEYLDREQFQIFAYYNFRLEDEVTRQLKPLFHRWRSICGITDQEAGDMIREDGIDILVDLNGHTNMPRARLIGSCPAPVQVNWIGYPNTTGMDCVDYRITDACADPVGIEDEYYTEQRWRLPRPFLCYTPSDLAPDTSEPPCVRNGYASFGSFNNHQKLSDECLRLWAAVLRANPGSRLVIKSVFAESGEAVKEVLLERLGRFGVDLQSIDIRSPQPSNEDHLAAYRDIDIALDSFPYHGTTTTCEALWMGVPVITLAGDRHASRVGVSLLGSVGLDELIADSPQSYVRIATELASDVPRLAHWRASMRERMAASPLMDRRGMGRDLGNALRGMWQHYCAGFPVAMPVETIVAGPPEESLRLHVGGTQRREGWTILDLEQREEVDLIGDIRDLSSFANESCGEVYCSHVLEHVGQGEILDTLNGIHRILAPGGRLYLSVPDIDVLAWLFINPSMGDSQRFHLMRLMFGTQADEHDFHKIGLNFDFMKAYLRDVGFAGVEHVESFGLFNDCSDLRIAGHLVSLNLIVTK